MPTLEPVALQRSTRWKRLTASLWYGEPDRRIEYCSATAVWFHSGLPPVPIRWVLIRDPLGRFPLQALLSTDPTAEPAEISGWFVQRWQLEVTFEETRRHPGVDTQRQGSDRAIARTTPILMTLFSLATLLADRLAGRRAMPMRTSAWYRKPRPTFSDALALVRRRLWAEQGFMTSPSRTDRRKTTAPIAARLADALCYAA